MARHTLLLHITQAMLKEQLHYNSTTGLFTRLQKNPKKTPLINISSRKNHPIKIKIGDHHYYAHRLAWIYMYGNAGEQMIAHINNDKTDNRIANLKLMPRTLFYPKPATPPHEFTGCYQIGENSWKVLLCYNNRTYYVGCYKTKEQARDARKAKLNALLTAKIIDGRTH